MPGITIAKAIELLSNSAYLGSTTFDQDFRDAEKLGIEALKWRVEVKKAILPIKLTPLPGEADE